MLGIEGVESGVVGTAPDASGGDEEIARESGGDALEEEAVVETPTTTTTTVFYLLLTSGKKAEAPKAALAPRIGPTTAGASFVASF